MLNYLPKYFTNKAISLYIICLVIVSIIFSNKVLNWYWFIFGLIEVVGFFYFAKNFTKKWSKFSTVYFERKLFTTSLLLRVAWVVFSYFFYISMTGQPFEFQTADAYNYHTRAIWVKGLIESSYLQPYFDFFNEGPSDSGYPTYLSLIYLITGNSIFITRLLKALIGAYTAVLIYKLATRNFGDEVGRMAGIFAMLMPNLILYCGLHLKEVEMVFLTVLFIERTDSLIRSDKYTFFTLLPILIVGLSLFLFRTVLGATAIFALFTTLFLSSKRVIPMNRRFVMITWLIVASAYFIGGRISTEVEEVWMARSANQETSLQWRADRLNGNKFSTYATKSIFAPLIFVIPFPTMVNTPGQENQQLINGGNFVKNILAFFVVFALIMMFNEKKWKEHLLILTFTIGYLMSIALSAFAQSERFHQPALPFLLILAAYGVGKVTNSTKGYYVWYLTVILAAIIAWSWFKLAGRGMA